jgi:hypothetical protein
MYIWKKGLFSFNGWDAKMYMGLKIYGNMKHGTHETLNALPTSLNPKFSLFFSFPFYFLGMN